MLAKSSEDNEVYKQKIIEKFTYAIQNQNLEKLNKYWSSVEKFDLSNEQVKQIFSGTDFKQISDLFLEISRSGNINLSYRFFGWVRYIEHNQENLESLLWDAIFIAAGYNHLDLSFQCLRWLEELRINPDEFKNYLESQLIVAIEKGHFGMLEYCWKQLKSRLDDKALMNILIGCYSKATNKKDVNFSLDMKFQLMKWAGSFNNGHVNSSVVGLGITNSLTTNEAAKNIGLYIFFHKSIGGSPVDQTLSSYLQYSNSLNSQDLDQQAMLNYCQYICTVYLKPEVDTIQIKNALAVASNFNSLVRTCKDFTITKLISKETLPKELIENILCHLFSEDNGWKSNESKYEKPNVSKIKFIEDTLSILKNDTTTILNIMCPNLQSQYRQSYQTIIGITELKNHYRKAHFIAQFTALNDMSQHL